MGRHASSRASVYCGPGGPQSVQPDGRLGANLVADERTGVGAQVVGVIPEIAPYRQAATECLVDYGSGVGLERRSGRTLDQAESAEDPRRP